MEKLIAPNTVHTTFHVRYAETDAMGIVHHSAYLVWFEEARSALMRVQGTSYAQFEADGVSLAVSEVEMRFIAPAKYDQLITVECRLAEVKSRKMTFEYTVFNAQNGQKLTTGLTRHICINRSGATSRIPKAWMERWSTAKNS